MYAMQNVAWFCAFAITATIAAAASAAILG